MSLPASFSKSIWTSWVAKRRKIIAAAVGVALVFATVLTILILAPVGAGRTAYVKVASGQRWGDVLQELQKRGLIRSAFWAARYGSITGSTGGNLKTGVYLIEGRMSTPAILGHLARGDATHQRITIPEGKDSRWIARELAAKGVCSEAAFLGLVKTPSAFSAGFPLPRTTLEGYLFPATYDLPPTTGARDAIKTMLSAFGVRAGSLARSPKLADWVKIASLIELEARVDQDHPLISAVIHNRLKKGMPLQIDATVLYAQGKWKDRVFYSDLKVDSPYNTYRNRGLPPTPICNPGEKSLRAAAKPAPVNYLYYVAMPDGSHKFSASYNEFLRNKRLARR